MTLPEFIENLKGLNSGSNFSDVLLESLYSAIKNEPLECAGLDGDDSYDDRNGSGIVNGNFSLRPLDSNPFLQVSLSVFFKTSCINFNFCSLSSCQTLKQLKNINLVGYCENVV